jgi:hypothetical protein
MELDGHMLDTLLLNYADIIDIFVQHIKDMVDFLRMGFNPKYWIFITDVVSGSASGRFK